MSVYLRRSATLRQWRKLTHLLLFQLRISFLMALFMHLLLEFALLVAVWVIRVADSLVADAALEVATAVDESRIPAEVWSLGQQLLFLRLMLWCC